MNEWINEWWRSLSLPFFQPWHLITYCYLATEKAQSQDPIKYKRQCRPKWGEKELLCPHAHIPFFSFLHQTRRRTLILCISGIVVIMWEQRRQEPGSTPGHISLCQCYLDQLSPVIWDERRMLPDKHQYLFKVIPFSLLLLPCVPGPGPSTQGLQSLPALGLAVSTSQPQAHRGFPPAPLLRNLQWVTVYWLCSHVQSPPLGCSNTLPTSLTPPHGRPIWSFPACILCIPTSVFLLIPPHSPHLLNLALLIPKAQADPMADAHELSWRLQPIAVLLHGRIPGTTWVNSTPFNYGWVFQSFLYFCLILSTRHRVVVK